MKLDNAKRAGFIKLIYMLIPLLVVLAAAIVYLLFDVKDLRYMGIAFGLVALFFFGMGIFKFNYIISYVGPDKIKIKFASLSPFNNPHNSVQIKAEQFHKFEIKSSLGGMRKVLILYQKTPSGLAQYPGIGITALKRDEIAQLKKAFDLILAINQQKKA